MENSKDVIQFRVQKSDDSLEEALLLANKGHYNTVVSRLYYAAFYAVSAIIKRRNL